MQIKTIFKPNLTLEKLYYGAESSYDQNEPESIILSLNTNYNIPRYSVDYLQSLDAAPKNSYHIIPINFGTAKWKIISEKPNSIQTAIDNNYYYDNNASIDKITQSMVLLYTETKPGTVSDAANLKLYWNNQFVLMDKPQLITDAVENNYYYIASDGSYSAISLLDTDYDSISEVYKKDLTVTYYELITEDMPVALYNQITELYKSTAYESLILSDIFKELPSYILIAKVENEYSDMETELLESEIYVYNVNDSKYYNAHFNINSNLEEPILDYAIGDSLELYFDINEPTNKINWVLNEYRSEQYSWLLSSNGFIDISSAELIYSIELSNSDKKESLFPQTYDSEVLFKEPKIIDSENICWNQKDLNSKLINKFSQISALALSFFSIIDSIPSSMADTGEVGQVAIENNNGIYYLYICVNKNTWRRIALSEFGSNS